TPRITRSVYRALYVAKNQATLAVVLQGLGFVGMLHRIQEAAFPRKRYARWRSTADLALFYLYGTVQVVIVKPPLIAIGELPEHGSTELIEPDVFLPRQFGLPGVALAGPVKK